MFFISSFGIKLMVKVFIKQPSIKIIKFQLLLLKLLCIQLTGSSVSSIDDTIGSSFIVSVRSELIIKDFSIFCTLVVPTDQGHSSKNLLWVKLLLKKR